MVDSFQYFKHVELQEIPITILKKHPNIPKEILLKVSISDDYYEVYIHKYIYTYTLIRIYTYIHVCYYAYYTYEFANICMCK